MVPTTIGNKQQTNDGAAKQTYGVERHFDPNYRQHKTGSSHARGRGGNQRARTAWKPRWVPDSQDRPCGLALAPKGKPMRSDLNAAEVLSMFKSCGDHLASKLLTASEVASCAFSYNPTHARTKTAFHVKCFVPPLVFCEKLGGNAEMLETFKHRFSQDYFGDKIKALAAALAPATPTEDGATAELAESGGRVSRETEHGLPQAGRGSAEPIEVVSTLTPAAPTTAALPTTAASRSAVRSLADSNFMNVSDFGPFVLYDRPLSCSLNAAGTAMEFLDGAESFNAALDDFEAQINETFGEPGGELFFYSVSVVMVPASRAVLIGAKVDESRFARTILPKTLQAAFVKAHAYTAPDRGYSRRKHSKHSKQAARKADRQAAAAAAPGGIVIRGNGWTKAVHRSSSDVSASASGVSVASPAVGSRSTTMPLLRQPLLQLRPPPQSQHILGPSKPKPKALAASAHGHGHSYTKKCHWDRKCTKTKCTFKHSTAI